MTSPLHLIIKDFLNPLFNDMECNTNKINVDISINLIIESNPTCSELAKFLLYAGKTKTSEMAHTFRHDLKYIIEGIGVSVSPIVISSPSGNMILKLLKPDQEVFIELTDNKELTSNEINKIINTAQLEYNILRISIERLIKNGIGDFKQIMKEVEEELKNLISKTTATISSVSKSGYNQCGDLKLDGDDRYIYVEDIKPGRSSPSIFRVKLCDLLYQLSNQGNGLNPISGDKLCDNTNKDLRERLSTEIKIYNRYLKEFDSDSKKAM